MFGVCPSVKILIMTMSTQDFVGNFNVASQQPVTPFLVASSQSNMCV